MRNLKQICLLMFLLPVLGFCRGSLSSYCTQGGQKITTNAIPSTTQVMQSYPQCQISVFYTGGPSGSVTTSGTAVTWTNGTLFNANGQWSGQTITINSAPYQIQSCASQTACTLTGSAGTQSSPVAYSMAATTLAAIFTSNGTAQTNPFVSSLQGYWQFYGDNGQYDIKLSGGGIPAPFTWGAQDLIDPESLPNTVSDLVCTTTNCLSSLCITATARHQTLLVSRTWDFNGTCAASQYDYSGGGWCPFSGHTTVLSGAFDGDLTQHICPAGNISFTGPVAVFYPEWFGSKADFNGSTGTDSCSALTKLGGIGGSVHFSEGHYYSSCSPVISTSTHIDGGGIGISASYSGAKTSITFAAGVSGINFVLGSRGSWIKGVWLQSLDSGANSDMGISVADSRILIEGNAIVGFGGNALECSATANCDNEEIRRNLMILNFGDSWHCGFTANCNLILLEDNSSQSNGGIGYHEEAGGPNTFIGNESSGDAGGGYDISGQGHHIINPYCEGGALFILRAVFSTVFSAGGADCTYHDTGLGSNNIVTGGRYNDYLGIGPNIGSTGLPNSATYYSCLSGSVGLGVLNCHDDTNNQAIFHYTPSTETFTFDKAVSFGVATPFASPVTSYANVGFGDASAFHLDGNNGSSAEVAYGGLSTSITSNTAGSEKADTSIDTRETGVVAHVVTAFSTGTFSINKTYIISTLPVCDGVAATPAGAMVNISNGSDSATYMGSVSANGGKFIQVMCTGASGWKYH